MKKTLLSLAALALVMAACTDPNAPENGGQGNKDSVSTVDPEDSAPYARVQLIEHFTGEDCGYCPYGMDAIYEVYSENPDKYAWVSNHYGFGTDEYSITESATIGKKLAVNGAPSMSLNREKLRVNGSSVRAFHPGYIEEVVGSVATEAKTMLTVKSEFISASNTLHVTVLGKTLEPDLGGVKLTVALTESGMQGKQKDYYGSWEGWKKFTHTHTVRTYATAALGDEYTFENRAFKAEYDIPMNANWVADNCEVVVWATAAGMDYPVLNAAKTPAIAGTKGGEDIKHGGVEIVPVPDTYPEEGAPAQNLVLSNAGGYYYPQAGYTILELRAYNLNLTLETVQGYTMHPYMMLYILAPAGATSLADGTYDIVASANAQPGNILAGERNDEEFTIDWSVLHYVYQVQGGLSSYKEWLLTSGTFTAENGSYALNATTLNGSNVSIQFAGTLSFQRGQAPVEKLPKRHAEK